MSSILDTFLSYLISKKDNHQQKITKMTSYIKKSSKKINERGVNKIELEKNKFLLKKKYYELGKYVSEEFIRQETSDFSYKEEYVSFNKEIKKVKEYIKSLNKDK